MLIHVSTLKVGAFRVLLKNLTSAIGDVTVNVVKMRAEIENRLVS